MELNLTDRHIVAVNMLLVVVLSYFAALSVNDVIGLGRASDDTPVARVAGRSADNSAANRSRAAYQAIVDRDIFNLVPPPAAPAPVVVEDLHLTLIGISQTTNGKPYAIVADASGDQAVYQLGEDIPGAGKLLEVDKDRAVIYHDGKQVAIELPKDEDSSAGSDSGGMSAEAGNRDNFSHRLMRRRRHQQDVGQ